MLSALTIGAAASKKESEVPNRSIIFSARASEVSGPVAIIVIASSGISVISSSKTVMFLSALIPSVTSLEKISLSTARAPPAGTWHLPAHFIRKESSLRISSFKSPAALSVRIAFNEFEHTSSPNKSE